MHTDIIPASYAEWHHCITVICQQELNSPYIDRRIKALNTSGDYMTKRFVELYGEQQRIMTLKWLEQAKHALPSQSA